MANFGTYQGHLMLAEGFKNMSNSISTAIQNKKNREHEKELLEDQQSHARSLGSNQLALRQVEAHDLEVAKNQEYTDITNDIYGKYNVGDIFKEDGSIDAGVNEKINNLLKVDYIDEYLADNPDSKLSFAEIDAKLPEIYLGIHKKIGNYQAANTGEGQKFEDTDDWDTFLDENPTLESTINMLQFGAGLDPIAAEDRDPTVESLEGGNWELDTGSKYQAADIEGVSQSDIDKAKSLLGKAIDNQDRYWYKNEIDRDSLTFTEEDGKLKVKDADFWSPDEAYDIQFGKKGTADEGRPYIHNGKKIYYLDQLNTKKLAELF